MLRLLSDYIGIRLYSHSADAERRGAQAVLGSSIASDYCGRIDGSCNNQFLGRATENIPKMIRIAFRSEEQDPLDIIDGMIDLAEKSAQGEPSSSGRQPEQNGRYIHAKGIQLIVDGTDPELVRDILETDLAYIEDRHTNGKAIFDAMTAYAPAFGMIGTLIGLILMLRTLDKPAPSGRQWQLLSLRHCME